MPLVVCAASFFISTVPSYTMHDIYTNKLIAQGWKIAWEFKPLLAIPMIITFFIGLIVVGMGVELVERDEMNKTIAQMRNDFENNTLKNEQILKSRLNELKERESQSAKSFKTAKELQNQAIKEIHEADDRKHQYEVELSNYKQQMDKNLREEHKRTLGAICTLERHRRKFGNARITLAKN